MNTWGIIGNELVIDALRQSVPNKLVHAYLFSGAGKVGKFTTAKSFVKSIQCQEDEKDFCGQCANCVAIDSGFHPDVCILEPAGDKKKEINVKMIRELQKTLSLYPYQGKYKVAIIREAQKMNREAANALLKTLEEPSKNVVLILTSSAYQELLPTILSRCAQYSFLTTKKENIASFLEAEVADKKYLRQVVSLSQGKPGLAMLLAKDKEIIKGREVMLDDLEQNIGKFLADKFKFVENNCEDKEKVIAMLNVWNTYFRDIMLYHLGLSDLIVNIHCMENIEKYKDRYNVEKISVIQRQIEKTILLLSKTNTNARLALENLMLEI